MDNKHADLNPLIFEWIEDKTFESLSEKEQAEVLEHFTREEYMDLHSTALYIRKGMQAGKTSSHAPVKNDLLKRFDITYDTSIRNKPQLQVLWKIAAVFVLFATGWLCHYLMDYKQNSPSLLAEADTVYVSPETVHIYDTVYIEKQDSKTDRTARKMDHGRLEEKRDATEMVPTHRGLPSRNIGTSPVLQRSNGKEDTLLQPEHI